MPRVKKVEVSDKDIEIEQLKLEKESLERKVADLTMQLHTKDHDIEMLCKELNNQKIDYSITIANLAMEKYGRR